MGCSVSLLSSLFSLWYLTAALAGPTYQPPGIDPSSAAAEKADAEVTAMTKKIKRQRAWEEHHSWARANSGRLPIGPIPPGPLCFLETKEALPYSVIDYDGGVLDISAHAIPYSLCGTFPTGVLSDLGSAAAGARRAKEVRHVVRVALS